MAALTTNLPSRLRQLLSRESAIGPSLKLDAEPPGRIKDFIDRVLKCPLQDIAVPLSEFKWKHNKGNFYHWRPLLLHFDLYFKTYVSNRNDLTLADNILEDTSQFPKQDVMQILRVLKIIFENCHNKASYDGLEHFKLLLASTDPEIVTTALETLSALVRINPSKLHSSGKLIACGSINGCLLSLAQGWGSKEEGLGLHSCVTTIEKTRNHDLLSPLELPNNVDKSQSRLGSTLYFEIHRDASQRAAAPSSDSGSSSSSVLIHLPDLHLREDNDLTLMKQCMDGSSVPQEHRFSLLTRIRYAHAFCSPTLGRSYSRICLLAFIVLVQSNDAHDELISFFANEPEYSNELIRIVRSEDTVNGVVRTLAMLALGAQLAAYSSSHERARILSGSSINFAGGNRMILLNVLQRAVLYLNSSSDPSSVSFVEAILQFYLLHVISSSSSASVVRGSGMVPTFLPLLEDSNSSHMHLVCCAVKTLQKLMDYSNTSVTLFKDLGGVDLLAHRLQVQVNMVISSTEVVFGEDEDDRVHTQKRLIKVLLKALGSATYSPANSTRIQNPHDTSMPTTLSLIFTNVNKFGGDIYFSAVTVMSEIIHKDPTCFSILHEAGLADAFLSSVVAGVIPSSKALTCIPNGLGAICLNTKGLESVKETSVLRFLIDIFTSKKYVSALNDGIVPLANAFEELLRHASPLRGAGVDIIIEIIGKITSFRGDDEGKGSEIMVMETDSEEKEKEKDSDSKNISEEQFTQLCVFHVMVLVHRTMENSETCRLFVEKLGIEALLKLLLRPHVAQSSEGMSIALHSTMVFKGFTQHHSAPLAHAFCSALRGQLNNALSCFQTDSKSFLLDPTRTPNNTLFSALFLVEFLLFLAASKDNRWVTSLLAEFGNGSKDVLESIGHVHREVLWQIAILDDSKIENDSADERPQKSEISPGETSDQRLDSFRQLIDPLLRTRMSGWNVESQFFDLLNLYRDIGRATTSFQRRLGIDASPGLRSMAATDHVPNPGLDSTAAMDDATKETEKQRSYHSSCCDMVKSLSFHIIHLFQELGKVMIAPSRRREDLANISPASKSVASTFALLASAHMSYGGHETSPGCEIPVSIKCRYFGKVIDFIDGILLDRPDSCNPILLNCLYGHGVVHLILTTFEATSQLLFAVNRGPPSPMDTDDSHSKQGSLERTDSSWIDVPLACYAKLMDHLVTSSFILCPSAKHYLTQSLVDSEFSFPRDGEAFVKVLQSMVLKAVLPVWAHPQFTDCSYDFISMVISIIRHVYSGVEVKTVSNNTGSAVSAQPPNETSISTIVEMGFSRSRAEEALRQVGANCVEFAMEWLFSHPAEAQEDDELARALAMSLGSAGSEPKEEPPGENVKPHPPPPPPPSEDMIQAPPVNELLSTCVKLLQMNEKLAFPVRDLLVMICSQNSGKDRSSVVSFIVDQVEHFGFTTDIGKDMMLSTLLHVLALILHEDAEARQVAFDNGFVKIVSDLLSQWDSLWSEVNPRWVTAAFLAVDRMLQVNQSLNAEIVQQLKEEDGGRKSAPLTIDEGMEKSEKSPPTSYSSVSKNLDIHDQKRLVDIACHCLGHQLPSETVHSILQLCSTLTRNHTVALGFLQGGGLPLLLSLPLGSLFPGFDNVAATIIRHILEDPQTLQQAMESEIRHSLMSAANRNPNGRLTPRNFISVLGSVISRDPVIFMQAARAVTEVEMVGDRSYIVLLKDSEKDKKEKPKAGKDSKLQITEGKPSSNIPPPASGKLPDLNTKGVKAHRKSPQSFISVIELLLDFLMASVPYVTEEGMPNVSPEGPLLADMDIDLTVSRGKGKAVVTSPENTCDNNQEVSASVAKSTFVLKLLTEILLMYGSSVHVLIRRDAEVAASRTYRGHILPCNGGIFSQTLHRFIPHSRNQRKEKKADGDWKNKLSSRASQFLVAACVRSTEARRRILFDVSVIFEDFAASSLGLRAPGNDVHAHIELVNDILAARSPSGSCISAEASAAFIDVGLVRSLTRTLQVLDLDHSDTPKFVTKLIKALELVTREHVHSADTNAWKQENTAKYDQNRPGRGYIDGDIPQPMETLSHLTHGSVPAALRSFSNAHTHESSEGVTDDMEHDQDFEGGFGHDTEDDYMREGSEEGRGMENSMNTLGIRFEIQQHVQESLGDDDDEMSGDDVEEDDDDDEEHNGLEEDEVHHMSHPDTDPDDHEIDDDEFVEEMLGDEEEEDEEEEEDDDEDGVILRLDEGVNGIDVLDHIEVFGRENSLPNETLHVMPVEVFGSRRQGRTTSIYSLLGRTGDSAEPSQHPLLVEPSSQHPTSRSNDNGRDTTLVDRSIETPISRLETIFHSLSEGRHGHRFSLWVDENQQGSIAPVVPQGLEELLVSQLRRPVPEKPSEPSTQIEDPQNKEKTVQLDNLNTSEVLPENIITNGSHPVISPSFATVGGTENADIRPENGGNEYNQVLETSSVHSQSVEMQFEQADGMVRDIEAVSQESSGSGATLGESLRSLDVEIGSTDGHDEGGERQGPSERAPSGDVTVVRPRRMNVPFGTSPLGGRDLSLHSVLEVSENPNGEADQGVATEEQQNDGRGDSGRIDPAFLDALPEEMRAEVLSAQQGQPPQPTTTEPQNAEDIDPEFLAALPPDIRAEVLAQQHAQRLHQSQELEGQPVEMDTVSIIATFPSELREEVLLTSSDAILANLTPALVAEANMLRERFAHRYYNRTLFGTHRRTRRGEGSRRGEGIRSNMERVGGSGASRRSIAGKPVEASGNPLVDCEALSAMIRLLRVVQPLYKGQLQKLLLHLCSHSETRISLVKILIEMLMLDTRKQGKKSNIGESSFRLYACQSNVTYSRPQFSDGVPPLVSRRILETMTFLARNHPSVAKSLLHYRFNQKTVQEQENVDERGKGAMVCEDEMKEQPEGCAAIALLLSLLNQPLYLRSIAHLEQLLNLMEVVIDNADLKSTPPSDAVAPATEQPSGSEAILLETPTNAADPGETEPSNDAAKPAQAEEGSSEPPISVVEGDNDSSTLLQNLPSIDLQLLCSFLAREGLSDNAYSLVAEVLKKLVAISPSHSELFITELAKSVRSLSESAAEELHLFREADRALLIASSSIDGAAVLRVLQSLSSLVRSLTDHEKNHTTFSVVLSQIHSINLALEPLWQELSSCISKIESYSEVAIASISKPAGSVMPPLPAGTQNILPYIESFFVTCEKLNPGQLTGEEEARVSPSGQHRVGEGVGFVRFSEKHRKLLNAFIRQNTGLLEKSFSMMLKMPRLVDFDNKRAHFRSKIKQQHDHNHHNPLRISVRRNYILEDSYNQLRMRSAQDIKGRLTVHFQGEEGIDAGGLTREWYLLLSRVIFDKGALLFTTVGNHSTFQPNPNSVYQTEHLSYFKFVGRVVAKALFDSQLLDVHFTRSFYKHILGVKVTYHDIEAIDPDYFKNLKWMLENDVSDILDLTFSIDADEEKLILYERTEVTDYELIPGGRNVRVTEENKHKYVDLVAEHKLTTAIRPQINSFLEGFNELIPRGLISIFNDKELELLISGLPDIDLDDLRANTEYSGYGASSQMVQWFWEVVQGISKEDRARLLQFVTGTSKVPLDGFSALQGISGSQKFQIHKAYGHPEHLPSAHTCFNQLDLPEYPSKEHLEDRLLLAIHEGNEGFGFG